MKKILAFILVLTMVCIITIPTIAAGSSNLYSVKDGWYYTPEETGILTVKDNKKEFTYNVTDTDKDFFLGLQRDYTGQLKFVSFESAAFIGDLESFGDALIDLVNKPGTKWVLTSDVTLDADWAAYYDEDWWINIIACDAGGYFPVFDIEDVGSSITWFLNYSVNIDLNGYTLDLSILTGTGIFENPEMGLCGIRFALNEDDFLCSLTISNGTLKLDYIFCDDVETVNLVNLTEYPAIWVQWAEDDESWFIPG